MLMDMKNEYTSIIIVLRNKLGDEQTTLMTSLYHQSKICSRFICSQIFVKET